MCTHVESHWWAFYSTRELTCVMSQVLACSSIWELINVQTTAGWRTDALSFLILGACLVLCFFGGKGGANCIRRRKHTGSEWSAERRHVKHSSLDSLAEFLHLCKASVFNVQCAWLIRCHLFNTMQKRVRQVGKWWWLKRISVYLQVGVN